MNEDHVLKIYIHLSTKAQTSQLCFVCETFFTQGHKEKPWLHGLVMCHDNLFSVISALISQQITSNNKKNSSVVNTYVIM